MPELPGPPEEYDAEQRAAWFDGAATIASLLSQQGDIIAEQYAEAAAEHADDDECPQCGAELIDSFGDAICPACGCRPTAETDSETTDSNTEPEQS